MGSNILKAIARTGRFCNQTLDKRKISIQTCPLPDDMGSNILKAIARTGRFCDQTLDKRKISIQTCPTLTQNFKPTIKHN